MDDSWQLHAEVLAAWKVRPVHAAALSKAKHQLCSLCVCVSCAMQMLIKGIRSFAPENNAAIEFYKPLTLIVGSNGAGKTVRKQMSSGRM